MFKGMGGQAVDPRGLSALCQAVPEGLGRGGGKGPWHHLYRAPCPGAHSPASLGPKPENRRCPRWRGTEPERLSNPPLSPAAGMGVSTVTATRILKGQLHHNPGEETRLEMDKFPYVALSKVSSGRTGPGCPPLSLAAPRKGRGIRPAGEAVCPPGVSVAPP